MRDDHGFNIKFVGIVESHPCLYDCTRDDYRVKIQEQAWIQIAKEIGEEVTSAECKNRWKNLRGSYTKHLKHYDSSGLSVKSAKRPYYLSPYMSFIIPFTKSRKPKEYIEAPSTSNETYNTFDEDTCTKEFGEMHKIKINDYENFEEVDHDLMPKEITYDQEEEFSGETDVAISSKTRNRKRNISTSCSPTETRTKRRKVQGLDNQIGSDEVQKPAYEYFERKKKEHFKTSYDEEDADKQFLLSLLPDFKKMTCQQKRKFKISVINLTDEILSGTNRTFQTLFSPVSDSYSSPHHSEPSSCLSTASSTYTYQDIKIEFEEPLITPPDDSNS